MTAVSLFTGARGVCCLDSDGWSEWKCVPKEIDPLCPEQCDGLSMSAGLACVDQCIPETCDWFCKNGDRRNGKYCSIGTCNVFGCGCTACIGGDAFRRRSERRHLSDATAVNADTSVQDEASNSVIGRCQDRIVSMYNTTTLRDREQIRAYFDCLDTSSDGRLDTNDTVIQELVSIPNGTSILDEMDSNGDGDIDPSEFDPALVAEAPAPRSSGHSMYPNPFGPFLHALALMRR